MGFNKSKVKSSAERHMTQGRISEAITEYRLIIENDPTDINTQNILGDLYSKSDETQAAVDCYKYVAEHYNRQGFAKKAIAIYNKIHRLKPDSISVSEKLAELYLVRGSLAEARKYYERVANFHEEKGNKDEALEIWEKLAEVAPNNTEIYLKIADAHWRNEDQEAAADAFIEGGKRLVANGRYEEAVAALSRALDVVPDDIGAIKAFVECQLSLGYPEEAVKILEESLDESSNKKEIIFLLADCHLDLDDPEKAEEVIVNLVVREPINYPKLFDLIEYYLKKDDVDSAVRILSMVSEQVLVSAKSERLLDFLNEILARNPEQTQALRLLARYHEWNKENSQRQKTLEQLLEVARLNELIEDERFALKQLVRIDSNGGEYSERLKEIHELHGSSEGTPRQDSSKEDSNEVLVVEALSVLAPEEDPHSNNGFAGEDIEEVEGIDPVIIEESDIPERVESIKFYVEQGYKELAENSLKELIGAFGSREEFKEVCELLDITPEDHFSEESLQTVEPEVEEISSEELGHQIDQDEAESEIEALEEETSEVDLPEEEPSEDKLVDDSEIEAAEEPADSVGFELVPNEPSSEEETVTLEEAEVSEGQNEVEESDGSSEESPSSDEENPEAQEEIEQASITDELEETEVAEEVEALEEVEEVEEEKSVYGVIEGSIDEVEVAEEESELQDVGLEGSGAEAETEESDEISEEKGEIDGDLVERDDFVEISEDEDEDVTSESEMSDEEEVIEDASEELISKEQESQEEPEQTEEDDSAELEESSEIEENVESVSEEEVNEAIEEVSADETGKEAEVDLDNLLDESDEEDVNDAYETHYHHAVAYKEMGLMEDAIREFQSAVKCIVPDDENGKYLQCSSLLGHCFMEKDMPKVAIMWFMRAYEVEGLNSDEKQALKYELANAYEANGDIDQAREHFEEIYAFDVDYRDVSERLEKVVQPVA